MEKYISVRRETNDITSNLYIHMNLASPKMLVQGHQMPREIYFCN